MAVTRRSVATLIIGATLFSGCGSRYVDIIARDNGQDPCAALGADQCAADTQDGCSLQPNPTGCTSSDPSCGAGTCTSGDPFVRRNGEALFLNGAPFSFIGTVSWGLAWDENGCKASGAYGAQDAALSHAFDELAAMHLSVLRVWAFQSYAGASGQDFSNLDRLVAAARKAGVRLIPVLENMQGDCSSGSVDDTWFASGYKSPYGSYTLSYRDYVAGLVAHFQSEPTIMAWELMHEAGGQQFAALDAFTEDMTTLVHATDANHLIALGLNDGDTPATSSEGNPSNYYKLQKRDEIDLVDVQDFSSPDEPLPTQVAQCRALTRALGKVAFVGAAAIKVSDASPASLSTRAKQFDAKLQSAKAADFRGYLVYDYVPKWQSAGYDFDARAEDPLAGPRGVLAQHASDF